MKSTRVLACDPGKTNFGFSVLAVDKRKIEIVRTGILPPELLVRELNQQTLSDTILTFQRAFTKLLKASKADIVVAERYMIQRRGTTGETVNMMLGVMAATAGKEIPMQIFMAATWKARLKKVLGVKNLDVLYKQVRTRDGKTFVPDHTIDATMQGLFFCERELGLKIERMCRAKTFTSALSLKYKGEWPKKPAAV